MFFYFILFIYLTEVGKPEYNNENSLHIEISDIE